MNDWRQAMREQYNAVATQLDPYLRWLHGKIQSAGAGNKTDTVVFVTRGTETVNHLLCHPTVIGVAIRGNAELVVAEWKPIELHQELLFAAVLWNTGPKQVC
jgi:hypothetical protein